MTPAIERVAMARAVQIALEAVAHDVDIAEPRFFEGVRGSRGAITAPADQHDRTLDAVAGQFAHGRHELRIYLPVRAVVPRDVVRAGWMPHEKVFHFTAAVDKEGGGRTLQERVRVCGVEQLHGGRQSGAIGVMSIIEARLPTTAASH